MIRLAYPKVPRTYYPSYKWYIKSHRTKNQNGEEGLFGHTSIGLARQLSAIKKESLVWLYGVQGTKGSRTSWINNKLSYDKLSQDIKEQIKT